jgi:hypothetical protein
MPLYEIAARLNTGSEGSLTSASRIALLRGDFPASAALSLERATRYGLSYAFRDYLSLLFALGRTGEARDGFARLAELFPVPHVWSAEMVGQRMSAMTDEQFRAWILGDSIRDAHFGGRRFAANYAIMWSTTDRAPPANFPALIQQVERNAVRTFGPTGLTVQRARASDGQMEQLLGSIFGAPKSKGVPGARVKSEYVLLAEALFPFYAGDYNRARDGFVALATYYSIEDGDLSAVLPLLVFADAKTGDPLRVEKDLDFLEHDNDGFDLALSRAFFAAVRHRSDDAQRALIHAFNSRPPTDARVFSSEFQFAQACELIARETGDVRFRQMLLDWVRRVEKMQPTEAWAYAMEASYSNVDADVTRALAMTLYFDPLSPRLKKFDASRIAEARAWLAKSNPFTKGKPKPPARGVHSVRPASPAT